MDRTSLVAWALALEGAFPVAAAVLLAANAALDFKLPGAAPRA